MTTILLIRHGQTDWNINGRWQGHTDVPLNETGKAQARALAQRLQNWPVRALYTSDLQRAYTTAEILGEAWGIRPIPSPRWRERDVGLFSGMTTEEIREQYSEFVSDGVVHPPNGEGPEELYQRVNQAFDELLARHQGQMIAVVSHGGTLRAIVNRVLGLPADMFTRFSLGGNTGLTIIRETGGVLYVETLNDTAHLQPDWSVYRQ